MTFAIYEIPGLMARKITLAGGFETLEAAKAEFDRRYPGAVMEADTDGLAAYDGILPDGRLVCIEEER